MNLFEEIGLLISKVGASFFAFISCSFLKNAALPARGFANPS
jgi:hypothetical protein